MTESTLDTLIEKYDKDQWIDCAWDDLNDEKEFETIMKHLKENKQLKEKLEDVEELQRELQIKYHKGQVSMDAQNQIRLRLKEILGAKQNMDAVKNE